MGAPRGRAGLPPRADAEEDLVTNAGSRQRRRMWVRLAAVAACALPLSVGQPTAQSPAPGPSVPWTHWGADEGSTRYSALDRVAADNFGELEVVWRWKAANYGPEPD